MLQHSCASLPLLCYVIICRTDVVEFVSGEHTPRNLLIRAVKQQGPTSAVEQRRLAEQYVQLKQYWGVVPHLEKLLREDGLWPEQMQQG